MKRRHNMPFGATLLPGGGVQFLLWAPDARRVDVCVKGDGAAAKYAMQRNAEGWHAAILPAAAAGTRYGYWIDEGAEVPDPASRFQPDGVHAASEVIDPHAFDWSDDGWTGRPWEETVLYELHVGAFTPAGTFAAIVERLDQLVDLGVTAIELMPVAAAPGARNWGYDGVYPFAPSACYGRPDDLKSLVQAAHERSLMVFLDVVYNHFGPEGNYIGQYAPTFFTDRYHTPWGAAIDFDGPHSRPVRDYFIHNALYWIEEFHLDGLRLDAVHAIYDASQPDFLTELAETVQRTVGRDRHVHLVLENDDNAAHYLGRDADRKPRCYTAQWNDDIHHACHVLLTGESDAYYADYADAPLRHFGRCLSEGFAYQGEPSPFRGDKRRGEPSAVLPPTAFVAFLQNHDQVGNRAFGERIAMLAPAAAVRAVVTALLLAPAPPLLFMGEEWAAAQPFPFFCDFESVLAEQVRTGRRREFARFQAFRDPEAQARIPDPCAAETFGAAKLNWNDTRIEPHASWLAFYRSLLALRRKEIVPRLAGMGGDAGRFALLGEHALSVTWQLGDGSELALLANLGPAAAGVTVPPAPLLYSTGDDPAARLGDGVLPGWSAAWFLGTGSPV